MCFNLAHLSHPINASDPIRLTVSQITLIYLILEPYLQSQWDKWKYWSYGVAHPNFFFLKNNIIQIKVSQLKKTQSGWLKYLKHSGYNWINKRNYHFSSTKKFSLFLKFLKIQPFKTISTERNRGALILPSIYINNPQQTRGAKKKELFSFSLFPK